MIFAKEPSRLAKRNTHLDPVNIAFLTLTPLIAIFGTAWYAWAYGITKVEAVIFFAMYFATGLGITGGYHRYYSHRTYECSKPMQLFYLIFGAAAVENSVINWCSDHRYHHRFVDTDEDPYNILQGGLYAHIGWIFYKDTRDQKIRFENIPDLLKDKLVVWQHKYYLWLVVGVCFVLPTLLGAIWGRALGGLLIGGFLRVVVVQHMTFFINSLAHLYGERPYSLKDTARDSWWLGMFTFGEGYHNFHHKFQADYRNGLRWYQFDLAKWWLGFWSLFGQAGRFKRTPEALILKAKLEVEALSIAKRLEAAKAPEPMWEKVQFRVDAGRQRLEAAYVQYLHAKLEYKRRKDEWSAEVRRQWHAKVEEHRAELDAASERWDAMVKAMYRIPVPRAHGVFSFAFALEVLKYKLW
jgi:stearoyl-CoA desaturase (Delta-9 desaturase)